MSIFDPIYIDTEADTKLKSLIFNRLNKDKFDSMSAHSPDEIWFIQDSELSGQPIVVDTRPVEMPTKLSEFQNDVPYLSAVSWSQVTGKPTIPTYTSQLTNNSGYVTSAYVDGQIANYSTKWRDWFQTEWPQDAVTFTALSSDSQVRMVKGSSAPAVSLEYTTNGGDWSDFVVGTTTITLSNVGDKVAIRAKTTNERMATGWSTAYVNYFIGEGSLKISGNINSLLNKNPEEVSSLPDYAFAALFSTQSSNNSFRDASELILPATSLGNYCYCRMFYYATGLEKSPYLPATTLANNCYDHMFYGCTSLTSAPELPATTLAQYCYNGMFNNCTSLTSAPELPATTLALYCYSYMFQNCTSLNSIKIGYTGNFSSTYFNSWVYGVSSTGTFYYNGSDTTRGTNAIPTGWTIQSF